MLPWFRQRRYWVGPKDLLCTTQDNCSKIYFGWFMLYGFIFDMNLLIFRTLEVRGWDFTIEKQRKRAAAACYWAERSDRDLMIWLQYIRDNFHGKRIGRKCWLGKNVPQQIRRSDIFSTIHLVLVHCQHTERARKIEKEHLSTVPAVLEELLKIEDFMKIHSRMIKPMWIKVGAKKY